MTKNYQTSNSVLNYFNNKLGVNYNIEIKFLFNDEFRKLKSNKDYYIKEENDKYIVFVNLISKQYGKYFSFKYNKTISGNLRLRKQLQNKNGEFNRFPKQYY